MSLFRTAVRASVATRVVGNVHRRQSQQWARQDQAQAVAQQQAAQAQPVQPQAAPPAAQNPAQLVIEQLQQLAGLRDAGVLTEAEFEQQKKLILAGS